MPAMPPKTKISNKKDVKTKLLMKKLLKCTNGKRSKQPRVGQAVDVGVICD